MARGEASFRIGSDTISVPCQDTSLITHIIVCKHQLLSDTSWTSILVEEPLPILLHGPPEERPVDTTDQPTFLPIFRARHCRPLFVYQDLIVKPGNDLFASINPLVPIPPDEGSFFTLLLQQLNAIVKLAHSLSYLLRSFGDANVPSGQRPRVEKLFESTVGEST